jgi:hypothetical protein
VTSDDINRYDARDKRERADVATILGILPDEHPAREPGAPLRPRHDRVCTTPAPVRH